MFQRRTRSIVFALFFIVAFFSISFDPAGAQLNGSNSVGPGEPPAVFDPDGPPRTRTSLAPSLTFGGRLTLEYSLEKNFDLQKRREDNRSVTVPELWTAFSFDPNRNFQAFLNLEFSRADMLTASGDRENPFELRIQQAFLRFKGWMGDRLSIQIGRQRFRNSREWVYDDQLDAARAVYRYSDLEITVAVGQSGLFREDLLNESRETPAKRVNDALLYGRYRLGEKKEMAAYALLRDDRSAGSRLFFYGLHADGEMGGEQAGVGAGRLEYWLELAQVRGTERGKEIRGVGFDLGGTYSLKRPWRPSLTLGYAFGSGGNPEEGGDRGFRQTGLQDNQDKWNGVTRFKYYGELFDPELSNLSIFTGGVGIRLTQKSSLDLIYHSYWQHRASGRIREAAIGMEPTGLHRRLGSEIDLVAGYREIPDLNLECTVGVFFPGAAFPSNAENALLAQLKLRLFF
ncbi:MAG: alginate export family protein [Candidatus Manganitrophaceae bacterium]